MTDSVRTGQNLSSLDRFSCPVYTGQENLSRVSLLSLHFAGPPRRLPQLFKYNAASRPQNTKKRAPPYNNDAMQASERLCIERKAAQGTASKCKATIRQRRRQREATNTHLEFGHSQTSLTCKQCVHNNTRPLYARIIESVSPPLAAPLEWSPPTLLPFLPFKCLFLSLEILTEHYTEFPVFDIKISGLKNGKNRRRFLPTGAKFVVGRQTF